MKHGALKFGIINSVLIAITALQCWWLYLDRVGFSDLRQTVHKKKEHIPEFKSRGPGQFEAVRVSTEDPRLFVWRCKFGEPVDAAVSQQRSRRVLDGRLVLFGDFGFSPLTRNDTDFLVFKVDTSKDPLCLRRYCQRGSSVSYIRDQPLRSFLKEHWQQLRIESYLDSKSVTNDGWLDLVGIFVPPELYPEMRTALGDDAKEIEERRGEWLRISVDAKWFQ